MAAPTIPVIRLGLIGTGLAVGKPRRPALCGLTDRYVITAFTGSSAEIPLPPEPNDMRLYGTEGVLAGSESERRVTYPMVVQRALDSTQRAAVLALDPVPAAGAVPLWRPRGSAGLFDGLPGQRISSSASFAA
ncbi:hypothetical protein [Actinocrispum sp. NPDC049592]|uniref:hypothetical protein n=1 Tax=Actinocrispum sp. NPDC049592 TaxID=3154835 RepID=UPI00343F432D